MNVLPERPCLICARFYSDGERVVSLPGTCVCPYPHYEPPYNVPWWKPAIDHSRPNPFHVKHP